MAINTKIDGSKVVFEDKIKLAHGDEVFNGVVKITEDELFEIVEMAEGLKNEKVEFGAIVEMVNKLVTFEDLDEIKTIKIAVALLEDISNAAKPSIEQHFAKNANGAVAGATKRRVL